MLDQKRDTNINSIIGLVLIFIILIGYSILTQPTPEEIEALKNKRDSIAAIEKEIQQQQTQQSVPAKTTESPQPSSADTLSLQQTPVVNEAESKEEYGPFAGATVGEDKYITIENELLKITISTKGGRIYSAELKNYQTYDSLPLILFDGDSSTFSLNFVTQSNSISTKNLYFKPDGGSFTVDGKNSKTLSMRLYAGENQYIEYLYSLSGESYMLGFSINLSGMQDIIASNANYMDMEWGLNVRRQEKNLKYERQNTTIYYKYSGDEVDYLSETSDERETLKTKVKWISFKQQFFTSTLIAENSFDKPTYIETLTDEGSHRYVKHLTANLTIPYIHQSRETFPMNFYFGPNHYKTLKDFDLGMEELIPLGWGIFGWVNMFIVIPTFNFLEKYIASYGIIILLLTIFIKILLFPLMYKSYQSTAKMRVLKPEVDEISTKFPKKEDAMKKQQAVMALYKKTGVNPLGGCLPMLVQMPILFAMFKFFPASIELRQESFLWADDLSAYDSIYDFPGGFSIPFYGDHISLFTLLMTAATLISVKMNTEMSGGTQMQMPQMKVMMYLMPIMFLGFFNDFASGLSYYYFIATMITFGQQYAMRSFINEEKILQKIQEFKKRPAPTKSRFQKRLERMAKKRQ